jgi:hypothetical protein
MRLALALLLLATPALAGARRAPPPPTAEQIEAESRWVTWTTVDGPAATARRESAEARLELIRRHGAGEIGLDVAFPALAGAPLGSRSWLAARRADLDREAVERARSAQAAVETLGDAERDALRIAATAAARDAEQAAANAERDALLLLDDLVVRVPALAEASLDTMGAAFDDAQADVDARWAAADGEDHWPIEAEARALQALRARWQGAVAEAREEAVRGPRPDGGAPVLVADVADGSASPLSAAVLSFQHALHPSPRTADILKAWADARGLPADVPLDQPLALLTTARRVDEQAKVVAAEQAQQAEEEAAVAQREAEEARREARDARGRRIASIKEQVAAAKERASERWQAAEADVSQLDEADLALEERLRTLVDEDAAVRMLPVLDPARSARASKAWIDLRELITELRRLALSARGEEAELSRAREEQLAWVRDQDAELERSRRFAEELPDGEAKDSLQESLDGWQGALDRVQAAVEHRRLAQARAHESVLSLVLRAKEQRRRARSITPSATIARDRENLASDLKAELELLGPNVRSLVGRRVSQLRALRDEGTGLAAVRALVVGSFWVIVGVLGWWWTRRQVPRLAQPVVRRLTTGVSGALAVDLAPFEGSLGQVGRSAVDLVALTLLIGPTRARLAELAALLVLARLVSLYGLLTGLFRLAVAPRDEGRPAFFRLARDAWKRADRAARMLLGLGVLSGFAGFVTQDLLGTEALASVAQTGFRWLFLALTLVQFWRAEAPVRAVVVARGAKDRVGRWVAGGRGGLLLKPLRGAAGVGWLATTRGWELMEDTAREGTMLGALVARLQSRNLEDSEKHARGGEPVSAALGRSFSLKAASFDLRELEDLQQQADAALVSWRGGDDQRGLLAVVGERGHGKGRWAERWVEPLGADGFDIVRLRPPERLSTADALYHWLGESLGAQPNAEAVAERLEAMGPSVFVVKELERLFLRRVGGFEAIRAILDLAGAHDDRHLWVFTVHAPAWRYLVRMRRVLNPDAFLGILTLPRRSGASLRAAMEQAAAALELHLDCSALIRPGTVSGDPAGDLERATVGYFRLLSEAARGNPGVAMRIWAASARLGADAKTLELRLPEGLLDGREVPLGDVEQLIAAALDVHGDLSIGGLTAAINQPPGTVRPALRHLLDRGVVHESEAGLFELSLEYLPGVLRTLRRRHFVYGKEQ